MNRSKKLLYLSAATVSLVSLLGFFLLISPEEKSLIFVFLPVIFVWVLLLSVVRLVMTIFFRKTSKLHTVLSFVGVSFVVLLFLLSGVGQLTARDIILMSALALISSFYFYRAWV